MLTRTQALEGGANVTCIISKVQFTYRSFIRLTILGHYATACDWSSPVNNKSMSSVTNKKVCCCVARGNHKPPEHWHIVANEVAGKSSENWLNRQANFFIEAQTSASLHIKRAWTSSWICSQAQQSHKREITWSKMLYPLYAPSEPQPPSVSLRASKPQP
jgi:hypothetical protein